MFEKIGRIPTRRSDAEGLSGAAIVVVAAWFLLFRQPPDMREFVSVWESEKLQGTKSMLTRITI